MEVPGGNVTDSRRASGSDTEDDRGHVAQHLHITTGAAGLRPAKFLTPRQDR